MLLANAMRLLQWAVGDIFITVNNINPSTRFGGTWELLCPGKTLVCVDTSDDDFKEVKQTGGEKTHKLSENEMPKHVHGSTSYNTGGHALSEDNGWGNIYFRMCNNINYNHEYILNTPIGGSQPHNNLQPYMACYIWVKTA